MCADYCKPFLRPRAATGWTFNGPMRCAPNFARLSDDELRKTAGTKELLELFAATAAIASRLLGQDMFDVQLRGALALARGSMPRCKPAKARRLRQFPPLRGTRDKRKAFT